MNQRRNAGHGDGGRRNAGHGDGGRRSAGHGDGETSGKALATVIRGRKGGFLLVCLMVW